LRLTVARGVPSARTAADKLPPSTMAQKTDIASRRFIVPMIERMVHEETV
jgi:hypothetical protein